MYKKHTLVLMLSGLCSIAQAANSSESSINTNTQTTNINTAQTVGGPPELAPVGKYLTPTTESHVYDNPSYVDSSTPDGGTAAEVPISPYVIIGIDMDQQSNGWKMTGNGGTIPFTDNWAYFTLGADQRMGNSGWTLGGYIKQLSYVPLQQNNAASSSNSGFIGAYDGTQLRFQAAYATQFGLANIMRVDAMTYYGAPGMSVQPMLRFEDFIRYDTQYNRKYYQFTGGRARYVTNNAYDARAFIGQGFKFNTYNTFEVAAVQDFSKLGDNYGQPIMIVAPDGSLSYPGIVSKQLITNSYTHVFKNKTSVTVNADIVGSNYFANSYQVGYDLEASFRVPF